MDETEENERRGIEGKSASGSDTNTKQDSRKNKIPNLRDPSLAKVTKEKSKNKVLKSGQSGDKVSTTASTSAGILQDNCYLKKSKSGKTTDKVNKLTSRKTVSKNLETMSASAGRYPAGTSISSTGVISGKVFGGGSNTYTKSAHKNRTTTKCMKAAQIQKSTQTQQDFCQNFPTPRSTTKSISADYRSNKQEGELCSPTSMSQTSASSSALEKSNREVKENLPPRELPKAKPKRKPIAYYLPLYNNASPIKVGSRILRDKGIESSLNKENRNILSNYLSALNASSIEINPKKKTEDVLIEKIPISTTVIDPCKSLKDALYEYNPDFIKKSEWRVEILRQIKEERCLFSELQRKLLEDLAKEAPKNQIQTRLPLTSIPKPKPRRLFNYKQMVMESKRKYEQLPEILMAKYDAKRMANYRTNRLMADVYQRKLKDNVLRGKVSMTNRVNILN